MIPRVIAAATGNAGKLRELQEIFALYGIECVSVCENGSLGDPCENADSFLGNARIKARAASSPYPVLADDSGVCVCALGGAPGINTARYSGEHANAQRNIDKLLYELRQYPELSERSAHFYCCCVLRFPDGTEITSSGICRGRIALQRAGEGGFGYDPVFLLPDGRCMALLEEQEKNILSHRGHAVRNLIAKLERDNSI